MEKGESRLPEHRTEEGIAHSSPGGTVVFQSLVKGAALDGRVNLLGVEDPLILLEAGIVADEQEVALSVGQDKEGFPLPRDLRDLPLRESPHPCRLGGRGGSHGVEAGLAQVLLLPLQSRRACRQQDHQRQQERKSKDPGHAVL